MLSFQTLSYSNLLLIDEDSNHAALRLNRMSPVVSFSTAAVHFAALFCFLVSVKCIIFLTHAKPVHIF